MVKPLDFDWYDSLFLPYDVAFVSDNKVRFENYNGWFEEVELSPELAYWILKRRVKVRYE